MPVGFSILFDTLRYSSILKLLIEDYIYMALAMLKYLIFISVVINVKYAFTGRFLLKIGFFIVVRKSGDVSGSINRADECSSAIIVI
jgi:hypothetical protein